MPDLEKMIGLVSLPDEALFQRWLREFRSNVEGNNDYLDIAILICQLEAADPESIRVVATILDEAGIDRPRLVRVMRRNRRKIWTIDDNPEFGRCFEAQAKAMEFALLDIAVRP